MKKIIALFLLLLPLQATYAAEGFSNNALYKICGALKSDEINRSSRDDKFSDQMICMAYIKGFVGGFIASKLVSVKFCIPKDVSIDQLAKVYLRYLDENPEKLHEPSELGLLSSIYGAFPCSRTEK